MNEPPRIRPLLVLVLFLAGCGILGLDGPTAELRVLNGEIGSVEDSASLTGTDPVRVHGVITLASGCQVATADVHEGTSRIALTIGLEEGAVEECHDATVWKEYRATIRSLKPGRRTLYVIHDGGGFNEKLDTVLVSEVAVSNR